jgi:L-asparaginase II
VPHPNGMSAPSLVADTIRSGVVESSDDVTAVVVDESGATVASWGDPDASLFYRSAIKPFQAHVSQSLGAALVPEHLAVACASHSGHPIHVETVRAMLAEAGLTEADLGTPPSWPSAESARNRLLASGARAPLPVYHNCSGKHAGFLRACVANGWPVATYRNPDHPLQRQVRSMVTEVTEVDVEPVGVDGCGAPTLRGSCRGLAVGFAKLSTQERFTDIATAMSRYPALVGGNERPDTRLSVWWSAPLKAGAEGVIGAGRHGVGVAAKSRSGSLTVAVVGMVEVMRRAGLLSDTAIAAVERIAAPPVRGGGATVGSISIDEG